MIPRPTLTALVALLLLGELVMLLAGWWLLRLRRLALPTAVAAGGLRVGRGASARRLPLAAWLGIALAVALAAALAAWAGARPGGSRLAGVAALLGVLAVGGAAVGFARAARGLPVEPAARIHRLGRLVAGGLGLALVAAGLAGLLVALGNDPIRALAALLAALPALALAAVATTVAEAGRRVHTAADGAGALAVEALALPCAALLVALWSGRTFLAATIPGRGPFSLDGFTGLSAVLLPLAVAAVALAVEAVLAAPRRRGGPGRASRVAAGVALGLLAAGAFGVVRLLLPAAAEVADPLRAGGEAISRLALWWALVAGVAVERVGRLAARWGTGRAAAWRAPIELVALLAAAWFAGRQAGIYGVALAAVGAAVAGWVMPGNAGAAHGAAGSAGPDSGRPALAGWLVVLATLVTGWSRTPAAALDLTRPELAAAALAGVGLALLTAPRAVAAGERAALPPTAGMLLVTAAPLLAILAGPAASAGPRTLVLAAVYALLALLTAPAAERSPGVRVAAAQWLAAAALVLAPLLAR